MPVLERLSPLRELDLVERQMRRMFPELRVTAPSPAVDVYETDRELVVELEVPGFEERELEVGVSGRTLIVRGKRTETSEREKRDLRVHERLDTSFERTFELPPGADSETVTARYEKGVLTVIVPLAKTPERRTVAITS
jgi:HSP20 family protein